MPSSWETRCSSVSQRWLFTILASIGLCMQTLFSVIMSITIIEMVVPTTEDPNKLDTESCQSTDNISLINVTFSVNNTEQNSSITRYPWDEYTQGIILSSFFWSSTVCQFFYGSLAERFGGKHLFGIGVLLQAVLTFLTPFAIDWGGSTALIVTRVIMGLGSDGMYPVTCAMIAHWTTPSERTLIGNTIYSGPVFGLFVGTIAPALIIKYSSIGWPAVFYFFGILGMVWFPFWILLVYENPDVNPFISINEFNHLKCNLEEKNKTQTPPWRHILTCKEFWAFTCSYIGCNSAYYVALSGLPRYMGSVLKFSLENNGYFSSFPYLFMWMNTMLSTWISDKIIEKKWMSFSNARKLMTTVSTSGPGIFLVLASYAGCDKTLVVILFIVGITMLGSAYPSLLMNPLDMSPNYGGSIMSVGSGIAFSVAIFAPYLIGILTPNSTLAEWRVVFWIVCSIAVTSNIVYLIWFKAEVQPWNDADFVRSNKTKVASANKQDDIELSKMVRDVQ